MNLKIIHTSVTLDPRPPLLSRGNIVNSDAARPGSISGRVSFRVEVFRGFPSTVRQVSGNSGHIRPRLSYSHHKSSKPCVIYLWTATVFEHSCSTWSSLNNKQQHWAVLWILLFFPKVYFPKVLYPNSNFPNIKFWKILFLNSQFPKKFNHSHCVRKALFRRY